MYQSQFQKFIAFALEEDLYPNGDLTTDAIVYEKQTATFVLRSRRQSGILSGLSYASEVYAQLDASLEIKQSVQTGQAFAPNEDLVTISGSARSILKGERLFINLIQRATSIATYTNQFAELIRGTNAKILDTRKTTPGIRELEKAAVINGGGSNHRFNLSTGIMIKDNHIALSSIHQGGIKEAVQKAIENQPYLTKIEVEVDSLEQLKQILDLKVDVVLLDNFSVEEIKEAKSLIAESLISDKVKIEISGGVSLNTVRQIAEIGVDYISVGSLTQSPPFVDLGLDFISDGF